MKFLITGGAGFIGSAVVRHLINSTGHQVLNVDKLTYAGNLESVSGISGSDRYEFLRLIFVTSAPWRELLRTIGRM